MKEIIEAIKSLNDRIKVLEERDRAMRDAVREMIEKLPITKK